MQDSVKSVKAEFDDLDGLSWETPEAQQILDQWVRPLLSAERPGGGEICPAFRPVFRVFWWLGRLRRPGAYECRKVYGVFPAPT